MSGVLDHAFKHPLKLEEHASAPLAGGIMRHGYQCGMLWGATLAAGAQVYQLLGPGPLAEARAIMAAQRLVESFQTLNNTINCFEITGIDKASSTRQVMTTFFIKGKVIHCLRMAARYAKVAFNEIQTALSEPPIETPAHPVSCTAMLAQKMGVSAMHTVMAAGFAGGIGLSGGACGALGAAIWINTMNRNRTGDNKMDFNDPRDLGLIDKFMQCSDSQFECAKIVGRRFESIGDHADYLRDGGCSNIMNVLATQ